MTSQRKRWGDYAKQKEFQFWKRESRNPLGRQTEHWKSKKTDQEVQTHDGQYCLNDTKNEHRLCHWVTRLIDWRDYDLRCRNLLQGRVGDINRLNITLNRAYVGVKNEINVMFRVGGTRITCTSQEASFSPNSTFKTPYPTWAWAPFHLCDVHVIGGSIISRGMWKHTFRFNYVLGSWHWQRLGLRNARNCHVTLFVGNAMALLSFRFHNTQSLNYDMSYDLFFLHDIIADDVILQNILDADIHQVTATITPSERYY
jgi:hypothetical protein